MQHGAFQLVLWDLKIYPLKGLIIERHVIPDVCIRMDMYRVSKSWNQQKWIVSDLWKLHKMMLEKMLQFTIIIVKKYEWQTMSSENQWIAEVIAWNTIGCSGPHPHPRDRKARAACIWQTRRSARRKASPRCHQRRLQSAASAVSFCSPSPQ